jgi:uncharacterized protein (TIGR03083 family)
MVATNTAMVRGEPSPVRSIDEVASFYESIVRTAGRVDASSAAAEIEQRVAEFLDAARARPDDDPVTWYGGMKLPASVLGAVVTGEVVMHAYDIATGAGIPYRIDPDWARAVFDGVIALLPVYLDESKAKDLTATIEIRVRRGSRVQLLFEDGQLTVDGPRDRRVDCKIAADPVGFLLLSYGRVGLVRTILSGKVVAWGPKPWLAVKLPHMIKSP